jgi:hypothetical protein
MGIPQEIRMALRARPGLTLPRGVTLGRSQVYQDTSRIEALYYRMFQFHNVYAWKGAYHFSADFAHWYGWAHLQMSLIEIKEEARKLRELNRFKEERK